jgi:hypothetical protein
MSDDQEWLHHREHFCDTGWNILEYKYSLLDQVLKNKIKNLLSNAVTWAKLSKSNHVTIYSE